MITDDLEPLPQNVQSNVADNIPLMIQELRADTGFASVAHTVSEFQDYHDGHDSDTTTRTALKEILIVQYRSHGKPAPGEVWLSPFYVAAYHHAWSFYISSAGLCMTTCSSSIALTHEQCLELSRKRFLAINAQERHDATREIWFMVLSLKELRLHFKYESEEYKILASPGDTTSMQDDDSKLAKVNPSKHKQTVSKLDADHRKKSKIDTVKDKYEQFLAEVKSLNVKGVSDKIQLLDDDNYVLVFPADTCFIGFSINFYEDNPVFDIEITILRSHVPSLNRRVQHITGIVGEASGKCIVECSTLIGRSQWASIYASYAKAALPSLKSDIIACLADIHVNHNDQLAMDLLGEIMKAVAFDLANLLPDGVDEVQWVYEMNDLQPILDLSCTLSNDLSITYIYKLNFFLGANEDEDRNPNYVKMTMQANPKLEDGRWEDVEKYDSDENRFGIIPFQLVCKDAAIDMFRKTIDSLYPKIAAMCRAHSTEAAL